MVRSLARLLGYPSLWLTAVRMGLRLRMFSDPAYMKFRMVTMYGDAHARPQPEDMVAYLRWCKAWEQAR